jgi:hypothetical protein
MLCPCGQELFIAPVLLDDQPVLMHESGHLFHNGRCFEKELSRDEIETLALFCTHEMKAPENIRLFCGGKFYDGQTLSEEDKKKIVERIVQK